MFKKSKESVRDHSEEREWLTDLGGGNLVAGVQLLLRQMAEKKAEKEYLKEERRRWKRN